MTAVEAWLLGGPVDGRILAVETTAEGDLPRLVRLPQTVLYVGVSDTAVPPVEHVYERIDDLDGQVMYRYRRSGHFHAEG